MTALYVELPSNIVYVAGYVNDVAKVFRQDKNNPLLWRANADVAEDNLYHIVLEMYDEAGNVGYYDEVIEYVLPVFVYDRTLDDVQRVSEFRVMGWENLQQEQKEEWLAGMKGCLNTSDLRRIEINIHTIALMLEISLQTNKDNLPEIPNELYFQTMLANVAALRESGYLYVGTPQVPIQPINTYQKVNDIERILHDIYEVNMANESAHPYCGDEIYTGDMAGIL